MKHLKLRFGTIEEELWDEVRAEAENERGAFLFRSGFSEGRVCCILLTLPGAALREEDRLRDFGFQPENAPNAAGLTGIPAERIVQLRQEAEDARRQAAQLTAELRRAAREGTGGPAQPLLLAAFHERGARPAPLCRRERGGFLPLRLAARGQA